MCVSWKKKQKKARDGKKEEAEGKKTKPSNLINP